MRQTSAVPVSLATARPAVGPRARTIHGAAVGILVLDTLFQRVPGDIGNAGTFDFPVQYKVVKGASAERVIEGGGNGLLEPFLEAADELVALGVDALSTSCGFLSIFQRELAARCPVPIATSSLMQVPFVQGMLPAGKRVGVLTYAAESLTPAHLDAVGVDPATPILGFAPDSAFRTAISGGHARIPTERMRAECLALGRRMVEEVPDIGAIVCECGNMPPYAADMAADLGIPVYDIVTMIRWLHAGLRPRRFAGA